MGGNSGSAAGSQNTNWCCQPLLAGLSALHRHYDVTKSDVDLFALSRLGECEVCSD